VIGSAEYALGKMKADNFGVFIGESVDRRTLILCRNLNRDFSRREKRERRRNVRVQHRGRTNGHDRRAVERGKRDITGGTASKRGRLV